jgi:hypothetical protein
VAQLAGLVRSTVQEDLLGNLVDLLQQILVALEEERPRMPRSWGRRSPGSRTP